MPRSAPPVVNPPPWSAADSFGIAAWKRLTQLAIAPSGVGRSLTGGSTATYDRHMSFLGALSVSPGGWAVASKQRPVEDSRIFRLAAAAGMDSRHERRASFTADTARPRLQLPEAIDGEPSSGLLASLAGAASKAPAIDLSASLGTPARIDISLVRRDLAAPKSGAESRTGGEESSSALPPTKKNAIPEISSSHGAHVPFTPTLQPVPAADMATVSSLKLSAASRSLQLTHDLVRMSNTASLPFANMNRPFALRLLVRGIYATEAVDVASPPSIRASANSQLLASRSSALVITPTLLRKRLLESVDIRSITDNLSRQRSGSDSKAEPLLLDRLAQQPSDVLGVVTRSPTDEKRHVGNVSPIGYIRGKRPYPQLTVRYWMAGDATGSQALAVSAEDAWRAGQIPGEAAPQRSAAFLKLSSLAAGHRANQSASMQTTINRSSAHGVIHHGTMSPCGLAVSDAVHRSPVRRYRIADLNAESQAATMPFREFARRLGAAANSQLDVSIPVSPPVSVGAARHQAIGPPASGIGHSANRPTISGHPSASSSEWTPMARRPAAGTAGISSNLTIDQFAAADALPFALLGRGESHGATGALRVAHYEDAPTAGAKTTRLRSAVALLARSSAEPRAPGRVAAGGRSAPPTSVVDLAALSPASRARKGASPKSLDDLRVAAYDIFWRSPSDDGSNVTSGRPAAQSQQSSTLADWQLPASIPRPTFGVIGEGKIGRMTVIHTLATRSSTLPASLRESNPTMLPKSYGAATRGSVALAVFRLTQQQSADAEWGRAHSPLSAMLRNNHSVHAAIPLVGRSVWRIPGIGSAYRTSANDRSSVSSGVADGFSMLSPLKNLSESLASRRGGGVKPSVREGAALIYRSRAMPLVAAAKEVSTPDATPAIGSKLRSPMAPPYELPAATSIFSLDRSIEPSSEANTREGNALPEATVDVDEIVERAWRTLMSRLAIERERRGFQRWA